MRDVILAFNGDGVAPPGTFLGGSADPRVTDADVTVIAKTATTRPRKLG